MLVFSPVPRSSFSRGFTLVELGIVLVVIGLLIGGVLKGRELLENAQIGRLIRQMQSYEGAMAAFKSTYDGLPGDLADAANRVPNCNNLRCSPVVAGGTANGNGIIEPMATDLAMASWTGTAERDFVFAQLGAAGLISYSLSVVGGDAYDDFPEGPLQRSQLRISHINMMPINNYPRLLGLYVIVAYFREGGVTTVSNVREAALIPRQARRIDEKIDDGRPFSGNVMGIDTVFTSCFTGLNYRAVSTRGCNLMYRTKL